MIRISDINDCRKHSCRHGGTCVDGINSFSCNCSEGFSGMTCETSKNDPYLQNISILLLNRIVNVLLPALKVLNSESLHMLFYQRLRIHGFHCRHQ